jgi:glycosyltransferase involved in cell wall biosynthesis
MTSILRWLWRRSPIPDPLRRLLERPLLYPRLGHIQRGASYPPGPPLVAGFLHSGLGIGEAARLEVLALREAGMALQIRDISDIHSIRDLTEGRFTNTPEPSPFGLLLLHVNAPEAALALHALGPELTRHRPVVGIWAWELPRIPPDWLRACRYLDELWVPSGYVGEAFEGKCPVPLRVVPHPVMAPVLSGLGREDFDLPQEPCLFLALADGRSDVERKNLLGTAAAFRRAFGDSLDVRLVFKVHHLAVGDPSSRAILRVAEESPNITLLDVLLPRTSMGDLLHCADVVVSLHRAEGFGLPLAEAMLLEKPVIATGFSGNMQFMTSDSAALVGFRMVPIRGVQRFYRGVGRDLRWADPDLDEAGAWMRRLAASPGLRRELGLKAAEQVRRAACPSLFCQAVRESEARWLVARQ